MKKSMIAGLVAAGLAITISGCASYTGQTNAPDDPNRTQRGALIGAAIGVAAGLLTGDDAVERRQHALVGAGIGALAGGSVGAYQDRQEAELRRQMAGTGVDVVRKGDNITLNMPGNVTFDFDSATVKPQFQPVLDNVASTLTQYNQTVIEVAGHTDSVGSDSYNQALSQRRANAVAGYLGSHGVMQQRVMTVGAGESRPIASNDTESGRAQNRRVEITLVPVEQGS
ncbi:OmpA family protein [Lysobacter sp. KIS68-7]|uniref:OmpA family protein n=1 Tax=Lysobacter sp. KIS68-7 TaxID=2904252 RepID=UPI001E3C6098|nr:OmpA family protein [Lysobacter sp. KIS68-7]UHQ19045.1 OmpA family protein [Lysobacter sp. KIS68-7]